MRNALVKLSTRISQANLIFSGIENKYEVYDSNLPFTSLKKLPLTNLDVRASCAIEEPLYVITPLGIISKLPVTGLGLLELKQ